MHSSNFKNTVSQPDLEVFFDGQCPMCAREIEMIRGWDEAGLIRFTDIADKEFDPLPTGKTLDRLMREIHARIIVGESNQRVSANWFTGVDVFRQMYARVGFAKSVWFSQLPLVRQMLTFGYRLFAPVRFRLAMRRQSAEGSCSGKNCQMESSQ